MSTRPEDQTILVTGASGFVGAAVVNAFLERGYNVRGTARNYTSATGIRKAHENYSLKLYIAIVEDMTKDGAFDDAVKGVDGVIILRDFTQHAC